MFCIYIITLRRRIRVYGRGRTILSSDRQWSTLRAAFGEFSGVRQIVVASIDRVQTSCGFGVPLMEHQGSRDTLLRWAEARGADGLADYRAEKNRSSIDGLPTPLAAE